jgi:hypothetical protein
VGVTVGVTVAEAVDVDVAVLIEITVIVIVIAVVVTLTLTSLLTHTDETPCTNTPLLSSLSPVDLSLQRRRMHRDGGQELRCHMQRPQARRAEPDRRKGFPKGTTSVYSFIALSLSFLLLFWFVLHCVSVRCNIGRFQLYLFLFKNMADFVTLFLLSDLPDQR